MIIIEGPNATGKTTYARQLASDLSIHTDRNWRVHKFKGSPTSPEAACKRIQESEMLVRLPNVIQDRSSIVSEYVYATALMEREPEINLLDSVNKLQAANPILIFMLDPVPNSGPMVYMSRGLTIHRQLKIRKLYDDYLYAYIAATSNLESFFVNRTGMDQEKILKGVLQCIKKREYK